MGLFGNLSERMSHIFSKLTAKGKLTELEVKEGMREIKLALLEADVNFLVVKDFINKVSQKAVGDVVLKSLTPGQQIVKIVNEEMIELMKSNDQKLKVSSAPPTVIMMCGLQGAGKTTHVGKLGYMLKKNGKKVLAVACDIYRPAAINQLKVVSSQAGIGFFEKGTQNPVKTAKQAIDFALSQGYDTVILDTAGRLHINEELMNELKAIKKETNPTEILLTIDAMTGQDAVTVAKTFNDELDISGVVVTKLDGDTRGGVCLSVKAITGKPIKLCGVGEKIGDLEPFYPDRIASRILGMGDVLTLIDKAQEAVSLEEAQKIEKAFRENNFTFEDYLQQMENIKKMGNINDLISMIPGLGAKLNGVQVDEKILLHNKAIVQSMTIKERRNPELIKASQKKRIAAGSGTTIQDVNLLLKQFDQSKEMLKQLKSKKGLMGKLFGL